MSVRILLADDHDMVRSAMRALLEQQSYEVVAEAADGRDAVRLALEVAPDVAFMAVSMPNLNGIEATRQICRQTKTRVAMLSVHGDAQLIRDALEAGAMGYLVKRSSPAELPLAIEAMLRGETYLSPKVSVAVVSGLVGGGRTTGKSRDCLTTREREVLQLVAEGKSSKEIANQIGVARKTIEAHRAHIMETLGLHTVAELTKWAIRHGLTSLEERRASSEDS